MAKNLAMPLRVPNSNLGRLHKNRLDEDSYENESETSIQVQRRIKYGLGKELCLTPITHCINKQTTFKTLRTEIIEKIQSPSRDLPFFGFTLCFHPIHDEESCPDNRVPANYELVWDTLIEERCNSLYGQVDLILKDSRQYKEPEQQDQKRSQYDDYERGVSFKDGSMTAIAEDNTSPSYSRGLGAIEQFASTSHTNLSGRNIGDNKIHSDFSATIDNPLWCQPWKVFDGTNFDARCNAVDESDTCSQAIGPSSLIEEALFSHASSCCHHFGVLERRQIMGKKTWVECWCMVNATHFFFCKVDESDRCLSYIKLDENMKIEYDSHGIMTMTSETESHEFRSKKKQSKSDWKNAIKYRSELYDSFDIINNTQSKEENGALMSARADRFMYGAELNIVSQKQKATAVDLELVTDASSSFKGLIQTKPLRKEFENFILNVMHSRENYVFWTHCEHFNRMCNHKCKGLSRMRWRVRLARQAQKIYDEFLKDESPLDIGVSSKVRLTVEENLRLRYQLPRDIFKNSQNKSWNVVCDQYIEFTTKHDFKKMVLLIPYFTSIERKRNSKIQALLTSIPNAGNGAGKPEHVDAGVKKRKSWFSSLLTSSNKSESSTAPKKEELSMKTINVKASNHRLILDDNLTYCGDKMEDNSKMEDSATKWYVTSVNNQLVSSRTEFSECMSDAVKNGKDKVKVELRVTEVAFEFRLDIPLGFVLNEFLEVTESVADQALEYGVKSGWTIMSIDDTAVDSVVSFEAEISRIQREGNAKCRCLFNAFTTRFTYSTTEYMGLEFSDTLRVVNIEPEMQSERIGVKEGWVLLSVNNNLVSSLEELNIQIQRASGIEDTYVLTFDLFDNKADDDMTVISAFKSKEDAHSYPPKVVFRTSEWWENGLSIPEMTNSKQTASWCPKRCLSRSEILNKYFHGEKYLKLNGRLGNDEPLWSCAVANLTDNSSHTIWNMEGTIKVHGVAKCRFEQEGSEKEDDLYCVLFDNKRKGGEILFFNTTTSQCTHILRLKYTTEIRPSDKYLNAIELVDEFDSVCSIRPEGDTEEEIKRKFFLWSSNLKEITRFNPNRHITEVIFDGYLSKQGKINTQFRRRWFQLIQKDDDATYFLRYFDDTTKLQKGVIEGFHEIERYKGNALRFTIHARFRNYGLRADNEKDRDAWVEHLEKRKAPPPIVEKEDKKYRGIKIRGRGTSSASATV